MIETGTAILKIDDKGEKYWKVSHINSKDFFNLDAGKSIELSLDVFEIGTEIKIYEKIN
jgi:hypothetical protein